MRTPAWISLHPFVAAFSLLAADTPPETAITNSFLHARVYLPDATTGFYRGTRFDWSGVVGSLVFAGHDYYSPWFQRSDARVDDFTYDGADIVAGPCTAITGPAEEFVTRGKALGFDEARPGGTFIKIGVGVLARPDDREYSPYRQYRVVDGGKWSVDRRSGSVEFTHELQEPVSGYGYRYWKSVSVAADGPRMVLDHRLRNTGRRPLQTSVYNHNFLFLARQPPGPDFTLRFPFMLRAAVVPSSGPVVVRGNQITFTRVLAGEDRVYLPIEGFGSGPGDYDIRVENRSLRAGVRVTADRPISRLALWAIRAPLSIEPFIDLSIEPGAEFSWRITYEYYTLATPEK